MEPVITSAASCEHGPDCLRLACHLDDDTFEPGTVPRDVEIDVLSVVVCSWCGDVAKVDTEGAAYEIAEAHGKAHEDAN